MKYLRKAFLFVVVFTLLITGFVVPASAADIGDYIYLNSSNTTYTIDVRDYNCWADIPSDQDGFTLSYDSSGYMFCKPDSASFKYIIVDDTGAPVSYNMAFATMAYDLCTVLEFDITETDASGNRKLTYYFEETFSGDRTIGSLAARKIIFYNETLGACQFVHEGNGTYVFGVGKKTDGSFTRRLYLISSFSNGKPVYQTDYDYTLTNGHYYGIDPCTVGDHLLGKFVVISPATCTLSGEEVSYCKYCAEAVKHVISALNHEYKNYVGNCIRCGDPWIIPGDQGNSDSRPSTPSVNPGGAENGGGGSNTDGGAGGGVDNGTDAKPEEELPWYTFITDTVEKIGVGLGKLWDELWQEPEKPEGDTDKENWFLKWIGWENFGEKVGNFFKIVFIIAGTCLFIGLAPWIIKFFKWVGKGISVVWKFLKKTFKSLSKKGKKK